MKIPKRARLIVIVVSVVAVVLTAGSLPWPKNAVPAHRATVHADGGCSLASLSGPYAFSAQGTLLTSVLGLPAPAPWGEVARVDFNGAGSFSASASVNVGGVALNSIPITGSYTVNTDCTASFRIPLNAQDTITEAVVVTGSGRGFVLAHTESFAVIQGSGQRLGD